MTLDELEQLVLRLTGSSVEAIEQQLLSRLKEQTFVGGKRVARQELPELPKEAATTVHRVKVSLYGAKPPVWRRLEIPSAMPLNLMHAVLQVAFDWYDYHLHVFETVCGEFGSPDHDDDWAERQDETAATLAQVAGAERAKVVYSYDFGDDWRPRRRGEDHPSRAGSGLPALHRRARDGPPEDCGGSGSSMSSLANGRLVHRPRPERARGPARWRIPRCRPRAHCLPRQARGITGCLPAPAPDVQDLLVGWTRHARAAPHRAAAVRRRSQQGRDDPYNYTVTSAA